MSRFFLDTSRSYGLRSRVGHGSTGSSPSVCPCPPVSLPKSRRAPLPRYGKWASVSSTISMTGLVARTVVRSQGPGAPALQPVGALGQLGKEQTLCRAENLFSRYGVGLCEYGGSSHCRASPISAELLSSFRGRTVVPGAYGIRSHSHAARLA
ncbi:Histone acetyltransferase KAT6B [Labeo rohita]|uniref:Histone acetyltransferase KAT6B n=1 Tax=Labeo rohita TaxID=84645 RepID=A0ABQ8MX58_LABRO|nr:Histone acetyltransferase KAT6B [Labeo rohita]